MKTFTDEEQAEQAPKPDSPTDNTYRDCARDMYHRHGMEIDDDAVVSRSEDFGAYVQAWVWVPGEIVKRRNRA